MGADAVGFALTRVLSRKGRGGLVFAGEFLPAFAQTRFVSAISSCCVKIETGKHRNPIHAAAVNLGRIPLLGAYLHRHSKVFAWITAELHRHLDVPMRRGEVFLNSRAR